MVKRNNNIRRLPRPCKYCNQRFQPTGQKQYYCERCINILQYGTNDKRQQFKQEMIRED